jgi:RNA polymerase-binding transcription factor DksA
MPPVPGPTQELEVDLAAFLPEGVELADASSDEASGDEASGDEASAPPVDEPPAPSGEEPSAPPVDLEALSQIERDLDAVDAAIAALDAGTYGIDPTSGEPIDDALLAADPTRLS